MNSRDVKMILIGAAVAFALRVPSTQLSYDPQQVNCLAHAVYHEARGEPDAGQTAVAWVVKNRSAPARSICSVVYEKAQFTNIEKTRPDVSSKAWRKALETAQAVLSGKAKDPTHGANSFFAPSKVRTPKWATGEPTIIGHHKFYVLQ